jgi:hypothetical protein
MVDDADSSLGQLFLNDRFRLFVCALAEMMMSNATLRVDEYNAGQYWFLKARHMTCSLSTATG